jgi:hypothetical protein
MGSKKARRRAGLDHYFYFIGSREIIGQIYAIQNQSIAYEWT